MGRWAELPGTAACSSATAPTSLEPSFGSGGTLTEEHANFRTATDAIVAVDGTVTTVGSRGTGSPSDASDFVLTRYRADGTRDTSFGAGGETGSTFVGRYAYGLRLVKQRDGKIVVAGRLDRQRSFDRGRDSHVVFTLARYTRDGQLDRSFGKNGRVITSFGPAEAYVNELVQHASGELTVAGTYAGFERNPQVVLARYDGDGTLDRRFGRDGRVRLPLRRGAGAGSLLALPNGKVLVGGQARISLETDGLLLARVRRDGSLDRGFGSGGLVIQRFKRHQAPHMAHALIREPDGGIVAGGSGKWGFYSAFPVARFEPNGSLDRSFGPSPDGVVVTRFGENRLDDQAVEDMLLEPDGRLVAAGTFHRAGTDENRFALAALR